jgi:hypothetical protein
MTAAPYPLLAPKLKGYTMQLSNHVVTEVLFAKEETLNCTYQQIALGNAKTASLDETISKTYPVSIADRLREDLDSSDLESITLISDLPSPGLPSLRLSISRACYNVNTALTN